ncbi:MAG: ribosome maturation factor RimM, partial [Bacteroidota bacterium]
MTDDSLFELGTVTRSHGIKGELVIYITSEDPKHFRNLKSLLMESEGGTREMKITALRFKDNLATVKLEGINDRNTSDLYIKKKVYLPAEQLPEPGGKDFYFHEVIGFNIHDKTLGDIGTITDVFEMPQHPVLSIIYKEKEALIPATPDFILKIDRKNKILKMDLP